MGSDPGILLIISVLGLGLGAVAWRHGASFLSEFHESFLRSVEYRPPWMRDFAQFIVRIQRVMIKFIAVVWLLAGTIGAITLLLRLAGIDLLAM